jgi:hypothetical protein|nr:MAG TPA: hypothetical protein [Caudoviricetes sp.]
MTNIKYLKDNGLLEAHKQFLRMCNEEYLSHEELNLNEDNEVAPTSDNNDQNQTNEPDTGNQDSSLFDNNPTEGDNTTPMGVSGNTNDTEDAMNGDASMGGEMPMDNMDDSLDSDSDIAPDNDSSDEDTIDIDDLTDAQEKINHKTNKIGINLGKVDNRIEHLMQSLEKMEDMIDSNNAEIMSLRKEFEKRNPTQIERIDMRRRFDSPGFNESPEESLAKRLQARDNYAVTDGGDKTNDKQYTLTQNDIDSVGDSQVADSFYKIDDNDIQDINKIFGF